MTLRTGAIYLSPKFLVSSSQVTVRVDSVWHVPGSANIQIEISLMRHIREYFPDFSNITHRFSFLWMLLRLSNEISLKFQLAHFSHHASVRPVKRSLHLIAIYPPRPPSVRRSEKFLHLAAAVFLCIRNGLQLRFICAQKFQGTSLFLWTAEEWVQLGFISRSLLPNFSTAFSPPISLSQWWQRPHSRSGWPINCPPQMGAWPKYENNALAPGLQSF